MKRPSVRVRSDSPPTWDTCRGEIVALSEAVRPFFQDERLRGPNRLRAAFAANPRRAKSAGRLSVPSAAWLLAACADHTRCSAPGTPERLTTNDRKGTGNPTPGIPP
jgi:hypothetical protein